MCNTQNTEIQKLIWWSDGQIIDNGNLSLDKQQPYVK